MNKTISPSSLLYIESKGITFRSKNGSTSLVNNQQFADLLFSTDALIIASPIENIFKVGTPNRYLLNKGLQTIPFYVIQKFLGKNYTEILIKERGCIFDRIILNNGEVVPSRISGFVPILELKSLDKDYILSAVVQDLSNDHSLYPLGASQKNQEYVAKNYWFKRANHFGFDGRAVCFASGARKHNKMSHELQSGLLLNAVKRAINEISRIERKLKLLDYGCGIGRFYPILCNLVEYYGVDISQPMIETARRRFNFENFYTLDEADMVSIPEINIFIFVTVLHHNTVNDRRKIFDFCKNFACNQCRIILIEDFVHPRAGNSLNLFPCSIEELFNVISQSFNKVSISRSIEPFGYPPLDYLQGSALLEIDVY